MFSNSNTNELILITCFFYLIIFDIYKTKDSKSKLNNIQEKHLLIVLLIIKKVIYLFWGFLKHLKQNLRSNFLFDLANLIIKQKELFFIDNSLLDTYK